MDTLKRLVWDGQPVYIKLGIVGMILLDIGLLLEMSVLGWIQIFEGK